MKILKLLAFSCAITFSLAFFSYGMFLLTEYVTGQDHVAYLQNNKETSALDEPFEFDMMHADINANSLVLVGEIHGFKTPVQFDIEFFSYLTAQHEFNTYMLEMDFSQAYFMNKYNQTGDTALLQKVLSNWVVAIGRDNQDYKKRWQQLQALYESGYRFHYLGNDRLKDIELLYKHLNELEDGLSLAWDDTLTEQEQLTLAKESIISLLAQHQHTDNTQWQLNHLLTNIEMKLAKTHRETVMTNNFLALYQYYDLYNEKVYGYYGIGHTLLKQSAEGHKSMAARLAEHEQWFADNTLAVNMVFVDSYMTVPSQALPAFLQEQGQYSKLSVSFDNLLTHYAFGIQDFKRVTEQSTKTLFKLNGANSPYFSSQRLFTAYKLIPSSLTLSAHQEAVSADYGQFALFIRDSDWAEPGS
ncbi:hypothetical protein AAEU32_08075 [Pseudoalteromonas sp. SSDWG2]|uniref:hypothetical protein n=1 Tax=Pseudoalteromonas sp. SSDWG2 TaxID=3139391 RepID=UPI003BAAC089